MRTLICSLLAASVALWLVDCDGGSDGDGDGDADSDVDSDTDADADTEGDADEDGDSEVECFELSLDPEMPLALDGTFEASSPVWRRPHDDPPVCPATALLPDTAAEVPFVAHSFCNRDATEHVFDFEMLAQDGSSGEPPLDDPYLILYEGLGIAADPLDCLAVNDDVPEAIGVSDSEITGVAVPPGGAITVVGTTFTFDPNDGTGTGYYVLVVTAAD